MSNETEVKHYWRVWDEYTGRCEAIIVHARTRKEAEEFYRTRKFKHHNNPFNEGEDLTAEMVEILEA